MIPKPINDYKCVLGEGPCWDEGLQKLWYIDGLQEGCYGTDLHLFDPETGEDRKWHIDRAIGCAIPAEDGRVLMNLQDGIYLFDTNNWRYEELSDLERSIDNNRLNDGKCDSKGRFWFGSMSRTANQAGSEFEITGSFYSMEHGKCSAGDQGASSDDQGERSYGDLVSCSGSDTGASSVSIRKWFDGVGISNGIAWNADETKMYYVDSTPQAVYSFDFDAEAGTIANRREIIHIDESEGCPDGMTIDEEGMLWIAQFGGWKVSRWNPETGTKLSEVRLPVSQVTCPAFGGKDYSKLYVTTASIGLSPEDRAEQPLAGATFVIDAGVKGLKSNKYR